MLMGVAESSSSCDRQVSECARLWGLLDHLARTTAGAFVSLIEEFISASSEVQT